MNNQKSFIGIAITVTIFSSLFVNSVSAQTIPPAIPPAPRVVPGETNYGKCLNKALLTRETVAKIAYQEFNKVIEPERVALEKAAKPFSGWLAWLNWFRPSAIKEFERLNKEFVKAMEKATPARDSAIEKSNSKFTIDQQYCLTHQDATYEWTPEDQKALDQLIPPRARGGKQEGKY